MEPSSFPFVSAYVDLTPDLDGNYQYEDSTGDKPPLRPWGRSAQREQRHFRPGIVQMRDFLSAKGKMLPVRGPERESFDTDAARIREYLEGEFTEGEYDPSVQTIAIFACSALNIWETGPMPSLVETQLLIDRTPFISPLAYTIDAYDRYAICLADSQSARVYVVTLGKATQDEQISGPVINYKKTGGSRQKRIQERISNAVSEHIQAVAQRLEEIVLKENVRWVIISGDEIIQTEFARYLSDRIKELLVETDRIDTKVPEHEAVKASLQWILEAERGEARDIARQALDAALSDGLGAAGLEAVVMGLRQGAVDTLILDKDFAATGWRCKEPPYLVGDGGTPDVCPFGPGEAEPANLREEMVTQAVQTGAEVEFVENSDELTRMGGVAALLRWKPQSLPNRVTEEA